MAFLVGTDEAGYGPNLGPLVVSATVWEVPGDLECQHLYQRLQQAVSTEPDRSDRQRLAIADSKRLYQSGQGLDRLELGLLAALCLLDRRPRTCDALWQAMAPDAAGTMASIPWYHGFETSIPIDADLETIECCARRLSAACEAAGVRLVEVRSRVVFEAALNRLIGRYGSKGEALSQATLGLVAEVCRPLPAGPIRVVCDKHGGRNRYCALLTEHFPEWFVEVHGEGRESSVYRFGPPERRLEVSFQVRAESLLPTALASMASKYLRELAMAAFNAFWCGRVPGLARTAGYPQDAKRFKASIAAVQAELGIADDAIWRCR